ncbi:hypothetical protein CV093_12255 [Oceanobacillus sp. 143]|uniref:Uncharacterized protein n=1 Tax=Oceanobacillus zhaokaii TaxID=2052660 RepID=A0A345PHQ0_9BACI|nr:hypothetical protein [Oceanobacillus zhaokaii]AXI09530.1 hypothetical protein CUC15_11620 [Oceanobacillus zhaokaii]QGS68907.1 hypothetical protein CV093_12255 [Oceanobacillus sp. 143]
MDDFFSPLVNVLKIIYDSIATYVIGTVIWIIELIRNFLLDTGIIDNVITATVIAVAIIFIIFLVLVGWFLGPLRVYGGDYDSDDN